MFFNLILTNANPVRHYNYILAFRYQMKTSKTNMEYFQSFWKSVILLSLWTKYQSNSSFCFQLFIFLARVTLLILFEPIIGFLIIFNLIFLQVQGKVENKNPEYKPPASTVKIGKNRTYLSGFFFFSLFFSFIYLSIYLSIMYLSIYLCIYLFIYLCTYVSIYLYLSRVPEAELEGWD